MIGRNHCGFCKAWEPDPDKLVKYGVRHYAHFASYLDAGKQLDTLPAWQIERFPYFLAV